MLKACGVTDKGRTRPHNEDCFAIDEAHGLCVVADGMGGHNAGEIAAQMAVDAVVEFTRPDASAVAGWPLGYDDSLSPVGNRLRTAIHLANLQILEYSNDLAGCSGMGTTIVAAIVAGNRLSVGYVGDSRLYVASPHGLRQLTVDDSWMTLMLSDDPGLDAASLRHHPLRHALTSAVGTRARTKVHVVEDTLGQGELLLLSTDGVHNALDDDRIERLMRECGDVRDSARRLVTAAIDAGSRDNCTAVVARYVE
jgi:protein phosphatase